MGSNTSELTYSRVLPVISEPDVLVCGVGCAGLAAAVSAARMGAKTMAIEQFGFAGGFMTAQMSTAGDGLFDMTNGELVVGGIALEILDKLHVIKLPLDSNKLFEPLVEQEVIDRYPSKIPFRVGSIERLKLVADRLLAESGAQVLYHTKVIDVVATRGRVDYVIVGNKDGISAIKPKVVIDCTGDADVTAWAGAPYEISPIHQPGSLHFTVGNIKNAKTLEDLYSLTIRCAKVLQDGHKSGIIKSFGGPWIAPNGPNEVLFNAVKLDFDSTSAEETSRAEVRGREDAWAMFSIWKKQLTEFSDAYFAASAPTVGARESRIITGEYTLTRDDIAHSRTFPDSIAKGSWYLDRHSSDEIGFHEHVTVEAYDIPYRTLLPKNTENLLVAGRCHSATPEALASSRVNFTAMAMGQAAGVAATLSAKNATYPSDLNMTRLQEHLLRQGQIFGTGVN